MLVDQANLDLLAGGRFSRLEQLGRTTSTNTVALDAAARGEAEGLVVVADEQTTGRGRFDRQWASPPGVSLLFSVLMRPARAGLERRRWHLAVAAMALALSDAARAVGGAALELKWPNDLVAGDAKVAGVLAEATGVPRLVGRRPAGAAAGRQAAGDGDEDDALVVGAGVNVAWAPADVRATCLDVLAGRHIDRAELLVAALGALDVLYGHWALVGRRYRDECATLGRPVVVDRGPDRPPVEGTAVDVDGDGHLLVRDAAGAVVVVAAGDVVHARPGRGA